jgi:enterochelin esterase family protein
VTVGPLKPEFWKYYFMVDGVRTLDPRNVNTARDGANYLNTFIVEGPASAPYQVADIPHGTLHIDWYASPSLKLTRRVYVYTPPGYGAGAQRYPVFYLLHGGGGDEDAWTSMGRTPEILDYLIAQGKARPMVVVMTNGNADQIAAQNVSAPVPRAGGTAQSPTGAVNSMAFPESLVADVIPYVEKNYRVLTGRENRAIAGLSMGGAQTVYTALTHPDKFAWVGAFSAGFPLWPGVRVNTPAPPGSPGRGGIEEHLNLEAVDKLFPKTDPKSTAFRLMYLSTGLDDFVLPSVRDFATWLKNKNIPYVNIETPGYGHVWPYWRICLLDFAPRLFQPK